MTIYHPVNKAVRIYPDCSFVVSNIKRIGEISKIEIDDNKSGVVTGYYFFIDDIPINVEVENLDKLGKTDTELLQEAYMIILNERRRLINIIDPPEYDPGDGM